MKHNQHTLNGRQGILMLLLSALLIHCPLSISHVAAQTWTDVTGNFITNPGFDNNDGWTWETSTGTAGIGSGNIRFFSGSFDFHQTLQKLPRGHYRLSVQTFYRDGGNEEAWQAHQNNSESLDAWLYAGSNTQQVVSIFSESLDYNAAGRCYTPDGQHYYPDGRDAAGLAFEAGLYWNAMEFDASGTIDIGIRCDINYNSNYCVADNFKLEYKGQLPGELEPDEDGWIDVTDYLLTNPDFDKGHAKGWTVTYTGDCNFNYGSMEFYNGTFNLVQDIAAIPTGKYRLQVQAFYRAGKNNNVYNDHQNGNENITAYLFANNKRQKLLSVYDVEFNDNLNNNCWSPNSSNGGWWGGTQYEPPFFPNGMASGSTAFTRDNYWNEMEFDAEGSLSIGLVNDNYVNDNWCMFDNFRLQFKGEVVRPSAVTATIANSQIISGDHTTVSFTLTPANALSKGVKWASSNDAVATVSEDGIVTGMSVGTATITATLKDNASLTSSVTVQVLKNVITPDALIINEIMAANIDEFISPAFNFDGWVELYNPTDRGINLSGLYVSDDAENLTKWRMPAAIGILPAHGFFTIWFDSNGIAGQNAPFKLDTDGGTVYFSDEEGVLITSQEYPASLERVSFARTSDGGDTWGLASTATPGTTNTPSATIHPSPLTTQQLDAPVVDQPSQLFEGSLTVNVTIPEGCTLRYTTDGTLPTLENGQTSADGRFTINWTSSFRFRLFPTTSSSNFLPSRVTTRSYIYRDLDYMLPVVSVVTDPDFLYSTEIGVMVQGPNGRPGNGQSSNCNWNMDWERPVNFSYLTADGEMVLNQDVDLEMCGGWSRAWTPHSFKLKGTKEMGGTKYLPYQFFDQKPYIRNRTLQIRNGGNDNSCRIKDAALQYLVETSGIDVDCQSYQPVHEFINGDYIGVLNVREPNNKHYVYANYGWDDDEIDQFEMSPDSGYVQKCGTDEAFLHLVDDLSPDAADADTYAEIEQLLDIDAYANYMAVEMYLGSNDWPQNNVKGFRHRDGGKFRFVLFDIDHAFNTSSPFTTFADKEIYTFDQLYPRSLGRITDQIRFVTLFKNMLANDTFRKKFIDAYCLVGGSVFERTRVNTIVDQLVDVARPAMKLTNESPSSTANNIKSNLSSRLTTALNALTNYAPMQLSGVNGQKVKLSSNIATARLMVNGRDVPTGSFNGTLFPPIVIEAKAPKGYTFMGWRNGNGNIASTTDTWEISDEGDFTLTAVFEPLDTDEKLLEALAMPIKVNEVSAANSIYCNDYFKRSDWFELYNTTDTDLNLAGLYVSDDPNNPLKYQIASSQAYSTIIPANGYRIVWADDLDPVTQLHTSFKLSNGSNQVVVISSSDEFVANNEQFFEQHPGLTTFVDGLLYNQHKGEQSVGRYPDGSNTFYVMNRPTIERTNTTVPTDSPAGTDRSWMELANHKFTLDLAEGWNWTSHIMAKPIGRGSLSDQTLRIVGSDSEAYLDSQLGMTGTLKQLEAGQLYKVQMKQADLYTSTAGFCEPNKPIALRAGWNWIGYTVSGAQDVTHALSGITAETGDFIQGQDGMATYTADGWKGTLSTLETGKGYMYKSVSAKTLRFSPTTVQVQMNQSRVREASGSQYGVNKYAYPNIMGVIAYLQHDGQQVEPERFTLLAWADDECRGEGQWIDERIWMNVYGDDRETITFRAVDKIDGTVYAVKESASFTSDIMGSYDAPRLLTVTDEIESSTDIASIGGDLQSPTSNGQHPSPILGYYSLGGTLVAKHAASLREGIYIIRYSNGRCRKICIK